MSAYHTTHTSKIIPGASVPVIEIDTPEGEEITAVWIIDGDVYWEDPGAATVQVGTPLEFHEWMVLHTAKAGS